MERPAAEMVGSNQMLELVVELCLLEALLGEQTQVLVERTEHPGLLVLITVVVVVPVSVVALVVAVTAIPQA